MLHMPDKVTIVEVGPRDGLQNEKQPIPTEDKVAFINHLSETGLTRIEITSFVNPKWIPQLSDAVEVAREIKRKPGITYSALVPNMKGLERAVEAGVDEVAVFMSASQSHNKSNINKTIEETYPVLQEVVEAAGQKGIPVRGYVSTAFGCPYEGDVAPEQVIKVIDRLLEMGCQEISIGDTIGVANPRQVQAFLKLLLKQVDPERIALHFHDTRGTALANILAAMDMGITTFDSSLGGLGGCPYAPGASGNVATEDLVYMLNSMGVETAINLDKLAEIGAYMQRVTGKTLPARYLCSYLATQKD
ncbi:MAG: hydroxymethylglutaryl-CoA lyase [Bacillaceae bacterium]|nr:hydroxymethylglutaryl-CoA lyase [Bacillaceae bacterium]